MRTLLLILALFLTLPARAQWVQQSPTPSGLAVRDVAFVTPDHGWLATSGTWWDEEDRRALLETHDGGQTWVHRGVPVANDEPLNGVFFLDGQHGWAYGNHNYRTTDGGVTWQELPFLGSSYGMTFYTPTFGRAFGTFGFARTADGGQTWALDAPGPRNFSFRGTQVGVGVGADAVYRTTDGGQTFSAVYGQGGPSGAVVTHLTSDVVVAIAGGSFVRSTDGGQTWAAAAQAQGSTMLLRVSDAVVLAWRSTGVAPNPDGRLLRSADGGRTWTDLGTVFPSGTGGLVAASPTLVLATDTDGDVYRSADAGATWALVFDVPFFGSAPSGMPLAFPSAEVGYLAYDYGHVYKTTDGGLTWEEISNGSGRDLADLVRLSGGHLVAVGLGGVVLVTEDGGANWNVRQDGMELAHDLVAAQALSPTHVASTDSEGRVFQSTDGGHTWARTGELPDPYLEFRAYDLHFFDAQNGWVVGTRYNFGAVYRTADGGQTWENLPFVGLYVAVDFEGDHGWIADNNTHYLRTTDGGRTWAVEEFPADVIEVDVTDIEFYDENVGYAVGRHGYAVKSTDGGQTWARIHPDPRSYESASHFSDIEITGPNDVWLSTYGGGVYRSTDGGTSWEHSEIGAAPLSFDSFTAIAASADGSAWLAGFKGYVYGYTSALGSSHPTASEPGGTPSPRLTLAVWPNPLEDRATVALTLPSEGRVSVSVFDVLGRRVALLHDGRLPAGAHAFALDALTVPAGVYVVHASGSGATAMRRLTVVR